MIVANQIREEFFEDEVYLECAVPFQTLPLEPLPRKRENRGERVDLPGKSTSPGLHRHSRTSRMGREHRVGQAILMDYVAGMG
jgi:hypothetical protein